MANPAIDALGDGLKAGVDADLTAAIGPLGEALAGPLVAVVIDLGEEKAHALVAALFARGAGADRRGRRAEVRLISWRPRPGVRPPFHAADAANAQVELRPCGAWTRLDGKVL